MRQLIALVLMTNAVAVLNEERFLRPRGWGYGDAFPGSNGIKDKLVPVVRGRCDATLAIKLLTLRTTQLHAMRVFRMPLILVNILTMAYLLILY